MSIKTLLFLSITTICLGWCFGPKHTAPTTSTLPTRAELVEKSWAKDTCLLVYADEETAKTYEAALAKLLANKNGRGLRLKPVTSNKLNDKLLQEYPVLYLTTGKSTLPIQDIPDLQLDSNQLRLDTTIIKGNDQVATFSYLPGKGGQAVHLIYSPTDSSLFKFIKEKLAPEWPRFLWRAWGYQLQNAGKVAFQGYFNDSTWEMDYKLHYDFTDLPEMLHDIEGLTIEQWGNHTINTQPLAEDFMQVRQRISQDWQANLQQDVKVTLYSSAEEKALRTQRMDVAHCNTRNGLVYLVENDHFHGMDWGEQYRPLLREALGEAHFVALEMGLALHYRTHIRNRNWRSWAYQLNQAHALTSPSQLGGQEWFNYQPLLGLFSAAAWVEYLLDQLGPEDFLTYYQTGKNNFPLSRLEAGWSAWINNHYASVKPIKSNQPSKRLNGFTLAHEGYRIFNGYGGQQTSHSLEALSGLGANAVSIVPYSYMRNPNKNSRIPVIRDAGAENDIAVAHAHFEAQKRGQFTLLKPQLWINGAWPGEVDFTTDGEWKAFFHHYRDWALHYALIAEIYQFDAYCIGTELRHTTLKHPASWRVLIRDIRKIYQGQLTYAANWGEECEQLSFWSDLDYIGVNNYYPLHHDATASDEELDKGAAAIMERLRELSERYERPMWLTELGYRSATTPWQQPHAEPDGRSIDEEAQARCYKALLSAMESEREWLQGMFWWKWPCYLSHNESNGRGYMPLGKPAAKVVRQYFK